MKAYQLQDAIDLARSGAPLQIEDLAVFEGYGFPDFKPIACTVEALAMLIRWECVQFDGLLDAEALVQIEHVGRRKFTVIDRNERGAA